MRIDFSGSCNCLIQVIRENLSKVYNFFSSIFNPANWTARPLEGRVKLVPPLQNLLSPIMIDLSKGKIIETNKSKENYHKIMQQIGLEEVGIELDIDPEPQEFVDIFDRINTQLNLGLKIDYEPSEKAQICIFNNKYAFLIQVGILSLPAKMMMGFGL